MLCLLLWKLIQLFFFNQGQEKGKCNRTSTVEAPRKKKCALQIHTVAWKMNYAEKVASWRIFWKVKCKHVKGQPEPNVMSCHVAEYNSALKNITMLQLGGIAYLMWWEVGVLHCICALQHTDLLCKWEWDSKKRDSGLSFIGCWPVWCFMYL